MILKERIRSAFRHTENGIMLVTLFFVVLLPFIDMVTRKVGGVGNASASEILRHLMIWLTMVGAMISSRDGTHISLAVLEQVLPDRFRVHVRFLVATVTASILVALGFASIDYFMAVSSGERVGGIPQLLFTIGFPVGFFVMALRAARQEKVVFKIISIILAIAIPMALMGLPVSLFEKIAPTFTPSVEIFSTLFIPLVILLVVATAFGAPVFVALAGIAALLFFRGEQMIGYLPGEAYSVLTGEIFPTIPLFTIAGFLLSESKSGERLVAFFRSLLGGIPGGMAIMAVVVCAFFTTFTGASGVTILALGGLLHYILTKEGYNERFSEGYLTASGSVGLMFPPSLPIILYGVQAQISIKDMFAGAIVPGIIMVVVLAVYAVMKGPKITAANRTQFSAKEVAVSFKGAFPELILPVLIITLYFTGQATLIETGVVAVVYMLIVNMVIHRDITFKTLPQVLLKAAPIAGSVLIILAAAKGLSYFIVDAEIPMKLTAAVSTVLDPNSVSSKIIFLLLLNLALLVVGCFMDIFSAIIVVVPLILPIATAFGINPIHLGVIFLANLELGYLTPPVGMNLFLASLRFKKPLVEIYKSVLPFIVQKLAIVLLITYVPALTLIGVHLFSSK